MPYQLIILGDANIARFWEDAQITRHQLVGAVFKPVSCLDTLTSALSEVNDGFDFVIVSILTTMLLEEGSASDLSSSCHNVVRDVVKRLCLSAKKSAKVEVRVLIY